jgi:transglutaminase-like putative cysteine protease
MRWRIEHSLIYQYSKPVALDIQTIRLTPRQDDRQQLSQYNLSLSPKASFITNYTDCENNSLTTAWFTGKHSQFELTADMEVEVQSQNPYDFILTSTEMTRLPIFYKEPERSFLDLYIAVEDETAIMLKNYFKPVLIQSQYQTVPFLNNIVGYIFDNFKSEKRKYGQARSPEKTISMRKGTCRDLAWLFVLTCRSLGIAARFVSGYQAPFNPRKIPELHAWSEVYLPGAGWSGFDPSQGLAISDRYITLAASYTPLLTQVTTGQFWGTGIKSDLQSSITIKSM